MLLELNTTILLVRDFSLKQGASIIYSLCRTRIRTKLNAIPSLSQKEKLGRITLSASKHVALVNSDPRIQCFDGSPHVPG